MAQQRNAQRARLRHAGRTSGESASQFAYRGSDAAAEHSSPDTTENTTRAGPRGDSPFRYVGRDAANASDAPKATAPEPMTRSRPRQANTQTMPQNMERDQQEPQQSDTLRKASPYRHTEQRAGRMDAMPEAGTLTREKRRLYFSDEERADPALKKPIRKADKAADKYDAAMEKLNRTGSGKKAALLPETQARSRPPAQPSHIIGDAASASLHRQLADEQDDNVGVQAVNDLSIAGESVLRTGEHAYYTHRAKPYQKAAKAGERLDRANIHALQTRAHHTTPTNTVNPVSRLRQRRSIRKQYAAAHRGRNVAATAQAARRSVETSRKTGSFVVRHRHGVLLGVLAALLVFVANSLSACAPLLQTVVNAVAIGTYPAEESDILAAERAYRAMENELQDELDHYTQYHPEYDEAVIDQQSIWHDPYALMALISARMGDQWTVDSAYPFMERLFDRQYELTERVERQTRYHTERGPDGAEIQVPYTYTICYVTLVNNNLSHLPFYVLSRPQISMYALYMSTLGNMPDLFAGNPYASTLRDPMEYEVPEELLAADESFARLIAEAEKYIGYPYVWGGDSPETSFDCSGFISYIFTHSGVYNIGRRGANGLYSMCRKISPEEARPGDLIFFEGTMGEDVGGMTHVGLYVGNNMMIHCGSPISYADLTDSYWQQHFFAYGRVPY